MRWWPFARKVKPAVEPGRVSEPEETMSGAMGRLTGFYNFSTIPFPVEYLAVLELLGVFNPDVTQALNIWVNLGNTGHEIEVESRNPEAALARINELAGTVNRTGGGVDGLVSHFLRQIPLMGALSGEWVVAERITDGIADAVAVPVKQIRFKLAEGLWLPFQYTGRMSSAGGYVELNPLTYSYMPMQRTDSSPYGIPPFYAALKNLEMQLAGLENIFSILRKQGLVGFLDVALEAPEQKPGESDESYKARLVKRLGDYAAAYAANMAKGVAVHYKDQEIKHNSISPGAAAGAKVLWEINEQQIFSALDIPPSMCGRSYSTTETYAEVDFERLVTKLTNARRMIKRFLEKGYELDLLLRGMEANVTVTFNQNSGFMALEKAQAEGENIDNVISKRDAGFIDDDEAARELGYEQATGRAPGDEPPPGFSRQRHVFDRKAGRYCRAALIVSGKGSFAQAPDRRDQSYVAALKSVLGDHEEAAIKAAEKRARAIAGEATDGETFGQAVWAAFSQTLSAEIAKGKPAIKTVTDRYVGQAWQVYRYEDTGHLRAARQGPGRLARQRAALGIDLSLVDGNALRYLTSIEDYYFGAGNYLADNEVTGRRFIRWLQDEYIAKGLNIKDAKTWGAFSGEFSTLVEETSGRKLTQIVSTTMSRIQNFGQTLSLYESGFTRYRIVGPRTAPICGYCRAMLGRVFDVSAAARRLAQVVDKGFENRNQLPPFLASAHDLKTVKEMSDEELQAAGFETPPFHPECRHRKAAEE